MKWPHRGPSGGSCRNFCDKPASPPFCWRPFACPAAPTCRALVLIEPYMLKIQTRLGRQPYRKLTQQPMPARAFLTEATEPRLSQFGTRNLPRLVFPDRRSRLNRTSLHALHCYEPRTGACRAPVTQKTGLKPYCHVSVTFVTFFAASRFLYVYGLSVRKLPVPPHERLKPSGLHCCTNTSKLPVRRPGKHELQQLACSE